MKTKYLALLLVMSTSVFAQERINEQRAVSDNERITIDVMRGDVIIRAHTEGQFRVEGTLDEKAEGYELISEGGTTRFEVKMPRRIESGTWGRDDESELVFHVPQNARLSFTGVNTGVEIHGVTGSTRVTTVNGDVEGFQLKNQIVINTVNGDIELEGAEGEIALETINGEIDDLNSVGNVKYNTVNGEIESSSRAESVRADTVNGEMSLNLPNAQSIQLRSVGGEIAVTLGYSAPVISASSVNGEIAVTLRSDVNASFDINAHGGNIVNRVSDDQVQRDRYGPGRSLRFSKGNGVGKIEIETVNGEISLLR